MTNSSDLYNVPSEDSQANHPEDEILAPLPPTSGSLLENADAWLTEEPTRSPQTHVKYSLETGEIERVLVTEPGQAPLSDIPTWAGGGEPWNQNPVVDSALASSPLPPDEVETQLPPRRSLFAATSEENAAVPVANPTVNPQDSTMSNSQPSPASSANSFASSDVSMAANSANTIPPLPVAPSIHTFNSSSACASPSSAENLAVTTSMLAIPPMPQAPQLAAEASSEFSTTTTQTTTQPLADSTHPTTADYSSSQVSTGQGTQSEITQSEITQSESSRFEPSQPVAPASQSAPVFPDTEVNYAPSPQNDFYDDDVPLGYIASTESTASTENEAQDTTLMPPPVNPDNNVTIAAASAATAATAITAATTVPNAEASEIADTQSYLPAEPSQVFASETSNVTGMADTTNAAASPDTPGATKLDDTVTDSPTVPPVASNISTVHPVLSAEQLMEVDMAPKSRIGAHLWSLVLSLILVPVFFYVVADGAARTTLPANNPWEHGTINFLAIGEIIAAIVLLFILQLVAKRSSLGLNLTGILLLLCGLTGVFAPGYVHPWLSENLATLKNYNAFGSNLAHHLDYAMGSGLLAVLGVALLCLGLTSHGARRAGRREGRIKTLTELRETQTEA